MIPTALEIRSANFLMWVSKFNLESMITPKYLTLLLWFNTVLFNVTFRIIHFYIQSISTTSKRFEPQRPILNH